MDNIKIETYDETGETIEVKSEPCDETAIIGETSNQLISIPERLAAALHKLRNISPDYVIKFELLHPPLVVITPTNDEPITFPLYKRVDDFSSVQIKVEDFQILNPSWGDYVENFIVRQIKLKMALDFKVKPLLKSFWIVQCSSNVTKICQNDDNVNTFGTLIIQLPSKVTGGKHCIISHKTFDFSIESDGKLEFSPFCIAFHRHYKHEIKPIEDGVGAYLVYDLMFESNDNIYVPRSPTWESTKNEESLVDLLQEWKRPGKVIIGLTNEYRDDELLFKNLKSTDLSMAAWLKKQSECICDAANYEIFLGFMTRINRGECSHMNNNLDTSNISNVLETEYRIDCLKHIDGKEVVNYPIFHVNLDGEVWPFDCFDRSRTIRCESERDRDNCKRIIITKYYRRPVIVLFKRYSFIEHLQKSVVRVSDIYRTFIMMYQIHSRQEKKADAMKFETWALSISRLCVYDENKSHSEHYTINLLEIFSKLSDLKPMKTFFEVNQNLTYELIPVIMSHCNKHGWRHFKKILCDMFKTTTNFLKAKKYLELFVHDDDLVPCDQQEDKKSVLQAIFEVLLHNENGRSQSDYKDYICSVWHLATNCGLEIRAFDREGDIEAIYSMLMELAKKDEEIKTNQNWRSLAKHCHRILEHRHVVLTWRQPDVRMKSDCECTENLLKFLKDDVQTITYFLSKEHRNHLKSVLNRMPLMLFTNNDAPGPADFLVLKKRKIGHIGEHSLHMLAKLRTICQSF